MTQTTWMDIHDRIVDILELITEFGRVYPYVPRSLNDADLPCVMVIPQSVVRERQGGDNVKDVRTYSLQVYLSSARSGVSGEMEQQSYQLNIWDRVYEQFDSRRRLSLEDNGIVIDSRISQDTGLQMLQYPAGAENFYFGIIFTLIVERVIRFQQRR
jgi:hypothetical protein